MDVNDGVWEGLKYLWQALTALLSGVLSYMFYRHKKQDEKIEFLDKEYHTINTLLCVFEERLNNIVDDIEEIKKDIKKVLYKL